MKENDWIDAWFDEDEIVEIKEDPFYETMNIIESSSERLQSILQSIRGRSMSLGEKGQ